MCQYIRIHHISPITEDCLSFPVITKRCIIVYFTKGKSSDTPLVKLKREIAEIENNQLKNLLKWGILSENKTKRAKDIHQNIIHHDK